MVVPFGCDGGTVWGSNGSTVWLVAGFGVRMVVRFGGGFWVLNGGIRNEVGFGCGIRMVVLVVLCFVQGVAGWCLWW